MPHLCCRWAPHRSRFARRTGRRRCRCTGIEQPRGHTFLGRSTAFDCRRTGRCSCAARSTTVSTTEQPRLGSSTPTAVPWWSRCEWQRLQVQGKPRMCMQTVAMLAARVSVRPFDHSSSASEDVDHYSTVAHAQSSPMATSTNGDTPVLLSPSAAGRDVSCRHVAFRVRDPPQVALQSENGDSSSRSTVHAW
jgi:hypothetical protein